MGTSFKGSMLFVITHVAGTKIVNGIDNIVQGSISGSSRRTSVSFSSFLTVYFTLERGGGGGGGHFK